MLFTNAVIKSMIQRIETIHQFLHIRIKSTPCANSDESWVNVIGAFHWLLLSPPLRDCGSATWTELYPAVISVALVATELLA